jgi:HK97 family phage prohead protease
MEQKTMHFEFKEMNEEEGTFTGYGAVFDNRDLGNDVIHFGAFTKSIQEHGKDIKICYQHDFHNPIGKILEMKEDEHGLWIRGKIVPTEGSSGGKSVLMLMRSGVLDALSIGYDTVKSKFEGVIRHLLELKLYEISIVTLGMNPAAVVTGVKEKDGVKMLFKNVTPYQNFSLADAAHAWDAAAAVARIQEWAGGKDNMDWAKYGKAFFWFDGENKEKLGSYKLPYADVVDGNLNAVPAAIHAVAGVLQGARGGADISEDEQTAIKGQVEKYYKKMDETVPWAAKKDLRGALMAEAAEGQLWQFWRALEGVIEGILTDETLDDKLTAIGENLDQFKQVILEWYARALQAGVSLSFGKSTTEPDETKVGRTISAANRNLIQKCHDLNKECHVALKALLDATEPGTPTPIDDGAAKDKGAEELTPEVKQLVEEMQLEAQFYTNRRDG